MSDGTGGEGGQGGNAIDMLTGGAGGGGEGGQGGGADPGAGGDPGAGDPGAGAAAADAAWLEQLSAEGVGEDVSHRDVAKAKGWKTPDDALRSYRELERAFRDSGRVKIPGEGASPEEVAAWRKATGVPESPAGYAIDPVAGADGEPVPLNTPLLDRLAAKAHELGVPAGLYKGLVSDFIQGQIEEFAASETEQRQAGADWLKGHGEKAAAKSAAVNRAAEALGLSGEEVLKIRNALGAGRTLDTLAKLGEGIGEDVVLDINGGQRFLQSADSAQAEIDAMRGNPETLAKMTVKGTPENAKYLRLSGVVEAAANRRAAS